jgi:predicted DNA-binding transcriptional regulator AlpA
MLAHMKKHPAISPATEDDRLILEHELLARVPFHRSTIYRKAKDGTFPAPIRIAANRNAWRLSAVLRWMAEREANPVEVRPYFGRKKKPEEAHVEAG